MSSPEGKILAGNRACARASAEPLSAVLRQLVTATAGLAILTCEFVPGGRVNGAGIPGPYHCARCNQPRMWHHVAAAIADVEWAEGLRAAGIVQGGIFDVSHR